MLTLSNVSVFTQRYGSIVAVFLVGPDKEAIEQRFWSFYNYQATNGSLDWWSDACAMFWIDSTQKRTPQQKLDYALTRAAFVELLQTGATKGMNPWPKACEIGRQRSAAIENVTWISRTVAYQLYDVGDSVRAEKGTGNFNDDVLGSVLGRHGNDALDILKSKATKETDENDSEDLRLEETDGAGVGGPAQKGTT